jgi:phosphinothricin acetyltransferase
MPTRPFTHADCAPAAALTNISITSTAIHFGTEPQDAAYFEKLWSTTRDRYPWVTATTDDGRFAGYAKAGVWRERAAYNWTPETGIYIDAAAQRKGLGKALYRALLGEMRQRGFHSAIGGITLPNEASVRLHESVGFVHVGTVKHAGWKLGAWHDVGFWQVMLHDASHTPTAHSA